MMLDRKQEKYRAKEILRGAQVSAYLFTLVFVAINTALNGITLVMGSAGIEKAPYFVWGDFSYTIPTLISLPPVVVMFLSLLVNLLLTALMYGYYSYSMTVRAGNFAEYGTLFDGFTYVGRVILLEIMLYCRIFLWSLLFVVPGFIAAYRYRFARLNLCENPDITPSQAIAMSKAQTRGIKGDLFVLDMSFLGWDLLVGLTLGLLNIYVLPYRIQTELGFYEYGKAASGVKPVPDDFADYDGQFHSFEL